MAKVARPHLKNRSIKKKKNNIIDLNVTSKNTMNMFYNNY